MILPLPTLTTLCEGRSVFDLLASLASAVAVWAHSHQAPQDPVHDITEMVRKPIRWTLAHPIRAIVRRLR